LRLMETLELLILELDGVELQGHEQLRSMRRAAVVEIQHLIQMLESQTQRPGLNAVKKPQTNTTNGP
uniref:BAG domain-containing protein n=1 Tax=Echinostoma caproni TaxID=27848 RepID=A0A183AGE2_9TREM